MKNNLRKSGHCSIRWQEQLELAEGHGYTDYDPSLVLKEIRQKGMAFQR